VLCHACKNLILSRYLLIAKKAYHTQCVVCVQCQKQLEGHYQTEAGLLYHPLCFQKKKGLVCGSCQELLGQKWLVHDKKNYHPDCLEKIIPDKCDYCGKGLVGRYYIDPWGQKVHASHRLKTCDCCHKVLTSKFKSYTLGDGRYQCGFCHQTSLKSVSDIKNILAYVLKELESIHIKDLPASVPVCMMNRPDLKRLSRKHNDNPKGLTKTQIRRGLGRKVLSHEIFILYGLPRIEFMGVLAHELMHVWLHENGIKLSAAQTEGLCNMATFMIYSKDKSELAGYLLKAMMKNPDPVYGQGYRNILQHVKRTGWKTFLDELVVNKELNRSLWKKIFG